MSNSAKNFKLFSQEVLNHIENYVVPQYGDSPDDPMTSYTCDELIQQASKYLSRYGRATRHGEEQRDMVKAVHCISLAHAKYSPAPVVDRVAIVTKHLTETYGGFESGWIDDAMAIIEALDRQT